MCQAANAKLQNCHVGPASCTFSALDYLLESFTMRERHSLQVRIHGVSATHFI